MFEVYEGHGEEADEQPLVLVEKESGPFVEHVDAALKRALYSDAVFYFINVRLTERLIKTLADEGLEPTRQSGQI